MSKKDSKKAPVRDDAQLMDTMLKSEVPCTFMGEPARLVPLGWKEDMTIGALLSDLGGSLVTEGVSENSARNARRILTISATVRFALQTEKLIAPGALRKEWVPVFKSMEEVNRVIADTKVFEEFVRLYNLHTKEFDISDAEKKS